MASKGIVISSIILSCSIIIGSCVMSMSMKKDEQGLMTIKQAAHYMNMSEKQFKHTIEEQRILKDELIGRADYNDGYFIQYYRYGEYYFSKKTLDEWIEFNVKNEFPTITA